MNQNYQKALIKSWEAYATAFEIIGEEPNEAFKWVFKQAYALGKQEKEADTVTIDKEEYEELCKYRRYVANWVPYFSVCPICREYNPSGCICANCDNDKNRNK